MVERRKKVLLSEGEGMLDSNYLRMVKEHI